MLDDLAGLRSKSKAKVPPTAHELEPVGAD
jgi:hypothetical protein